jgi:MFS family permease
VKLKQKKLKFLLFVYLLSQVAFYSFAPLYALFATDLDLDLKSISFIWSGYSFLTALFILIMGKLENKQDKGRMVVLGLSLLTICSVLLVTANDQSSLMIALAVNALGSGVTFPAYKTMFAQNQTTGRESEQWAWLDAGNMLSSAIGAGAGGMLVAVFHFQGLFMSMAVMQFLATIVAYKGLSGAR